MTLLKHLDPAVPEPEVIDAAGIFHNLKPPFVLHQLKFGRYKRKRYPKCINKINTTQCYGSFLSTYFQIRNAGRCIGQEKKILIIKTANTGAALNVYQALF